MFDPGLFRLDGEIALVGERGLLRHADPPARELDVGAGEVQARFHRALRRSCGCDGSALGASRSAADAQSAFDRGPTTLHASA